MGNEKTLRGQERQWAKPQVPTPAALIFNIGDHHPEQPLAASPSSIRCPVARERGARSTLLGKQDP